MQAREYRPDLGHFLSQDRFESAVADDFLQADPLTQNRYSFAGGNPVNNVEFDGHGWGNDVLGALNSVASGVGSSLSRGGHLATGGGTASGAGSSLASTRPTPPSIVPLSDAASRSYDLFGGRPGPRNLYPGQCLAVSRGGTCTQAVYGGNPQVDNGRLKDPGMLQFIMTLPFGGGEGEGARAGVELAPKIFSAVRGLFEGGAAQAALAKGATETGLQAAGAAARVAAGDAGQAANAGTEVGTDLVVRNPLSQHAIERMAEREVTRAQVDAAIQKGTQYYDRRNAAIVHVLEGGFASGKTLLVGTNPISELVTTVISQSRRFNPLVEFNGSPRYIPIP
jgi:RHS repeat-associated protein